MTAGCMAASRGCNRKNRLKKMPACRTILHAPGRKPKAAVPHLKSQKDMLRDRSRHRTDMRKLK